ncbi:restriction endonuclease fold toxin [Streptomyces sp. NPDC051098]
MGPRALGREIDAISDEYVAQSKPEGMQMGHPPRPGQGDIRVRAAIG